MRVSNPFQLTESRLVLVPQGNPIPNDVEQGTTNLQILFTMLIIKRNQTKVEEIANWELRVKLKLQTARVLDQETGILYRIRNKQQESTAQY